MAEQRRTTTNDDHLFVVRDDRDGESRHITAATAKAAAEIADWLCQRGSTAYWGLRRDFGLDGPVQLLSRYRQGVVGESKRSIHIFPLWPGQWVVDGLTAYCGTGMRVDHMEFGPVGMPCVLCTVLSASAASTPPPTGTDPAPLDEPLPERQPGEHMHSALDSRPPVTPGPDLHVLQQVRAGLQRLLTTPQSKHQAT
jgi:hypothetical protein